MENQHLHGPCTFPPPSHSRPTSKTQQAHLHNLRRQNVKVRRQINAVPILRWQPDTPEVRDNLQPLLENRGL